jgi:hypothetical protein
MERGPVQACNHTWLHLALQRQADTASCLVQATRCCAQSPNGMHVQLQYEGLHQYSVQSPACAALTRLQQPGRTPAVVLQPNLQRIQTNCICKCYCMQGSAWRTASTQAGATSVADNTLIRPPTTHDPSNITPMQPVSVKAEPERLGIHQGSGLEVCNINTVSSRHTKLCSNPLPA